MKTCFFIGHRDSPASLFPMLAEEVERHITEYGVADFVVGHYGRFDTLAAEAVLNAKQRHPEVTLTLLLPYHPAERPISTPDGFDRTLYPEGMETAPKRLAIVRANRWMLCHSDYLIAYVWHTASNSRELLEYAKRRERQGLLQVTNLAE